MPTRTRPMAVTRPKRAKVALRSRSRMPSPATLAPTRKRGMALPSLEIILSLHRPDEARPQVSRARTPNIPSGIRPLGARPSSTGADLHRGAAHLDDDRAVAVGAQGGHAVRGEG